MATDLPSNTPALRPLGAAPAAERRTIFLRAYAEPQKKKSSRKADAHPSDWVLVFDTETTDDETQRLRFGTFQLRKASLLKRKGIFFDPEAVSQSEVETLQRESVRHACDLLTLREFVDTMIFDGVYAVGGTIVGFNLPFDISRLAIKHGTAPRIRRRNGSIDRSMVGGFTFTLSPLAERSHVRVKHLSRRASFINFAQSAGQFTPQHMRSKGQKVLPERGFFLDLKTLAAALTSTSHSLKSLATFLGVAEKADFNDFARAIDLEMIAYAVQDAETTWQCYAALIKKYEVHQLETPPHRIYSEASLGKAYLNAMGIKPWRTTQPGFDPEIIGAVMSSYFGGRAEVHRRREVVRSLYCDFTSMYPTVCTLMGLWRFVTADGVDCEDATDAVRHFLDEVDRTRLQDRSTWTEMPVLVQVIPEADIFPVRARYGEEPTATIGVNYLSADRPLWFTLADCIASKLLTGKVPRVVRAIRFAPKPVQAGLQSVSIAGIEGYRIEPAKDDFYRRVIDLRRVVQDDRRDARRRGDQQRAERLDAEQLALKILANATSYGVFIELNVEEVDDAETIGVHGADGAFSSAPKKREQPGSFFHPLLATLITGAARLMLATTERLLLDRGLDWAFCDTDSMAFAMPEGMEPAVFEERVRDVCRWFEPLNPYEKKGSILKIEDQNYERQSSTPAPLFCFAVSAKRYALFNLDGAGNPVIRKASAHGLGHLHPPYSDDDADRQDRDSGVRLWQEDVWKATVRAAFTKHPRNVPLDWHANLNNPAASQYAATAPDILRWFKAYNRDRPYKEQIRPFNFLLWFHAKRPEDRLAGDPEKVWDARTRRPKPVAPYNRDPMLVLDKVRDRETGEPVSREWLRSYADVLRAYHIHPETKFLGGRPADAGTLLRRHIFVDAIEHIGKEGDNWEEDELMGSDAELIVTYGLTLSRPRTDDRDNPKSPKRKLKTRARVSIDTIERALASGSDAPDRTLRRLFDAALAIERDDESESRSSG